MEWSDINIVVEMIKPDVLTLDLLILIGFKKKMERMEVGLGMKVNISILHRLGS